MSQQTQSQSTRGKRGRPPKYKSPLPPIQPDMPAAEPIRSQSSPALIPQAEDQVFALDIGTRTVIGVVGRRLDGNIFRVEGYEQMEHPGRAMIDGQVEDIAQVGRLIQDVKSRLEQRLGISLSRVSIAAAGRMLRTIQVSVTRELATPHSLADKDMVIGLEGEAIELAQEQILREGDRPGDSNYYCVGYSIVEYRMDGQPVSQLVGHTCSEISVELIAAFLPYSVVEGLYAAVDISDLEVTSLTLEPIAAINVLIPRELRLLNLALVDIGAGTSDIAICRDGRISSYEMATIAGDELTETLIRNYLVDFSTAENLKRSLSQDVELLDYENILGISQRIESEKVMASLNDTVRHLAATIAEKIVSCNGSAPAAVFLIGGGSQIPGLADAVAASLGITAENVAVGPRRSLKGIDAQDFPALSGPEFVTPLGIAVTSITQECFHFFGVSVNGRRLKLLNTTHMRLMDVLLMAGYRSGQIIARSGRNLTFTLNGAQRTIRGELPEHAIVTINGQTASIDTDVRPGDVIMVTPAKAGESASASAGDFLPKDGKALILINGQPASPSTQIAQGDNVEILPLPSEGYDSMLPKEFSHAVSGGDTAAREEPPQPDLPESPTLEVPSEPAPSESEAQEESQPDSYGGSSLNITLNGEAVSLPLDEEHSGYLAMHLLERAGIDPADPKGELVLECNGMVVGFAHKLPQNARVRIYWR